MFYPLHQSNEFLNVSIKKVSIKILSNIHVYANSLLWNFKRKLVKKDVKWTLCDNLKFRNYHIILYQIFHLKQYSPSSYCVNRFCIWNMKQKCSTIQEKLDTEIKTVVWKLITWLILCLQLVPYWLTFVLWGWQWLFPFCSPGNDWWHP